MKKLSTKLFISFLALTGTVIYIIFLASYQKTYQLFLDSLATTRGEVLDRTSDSIDNMTSSLMFAMSVGPFQRQLKEIATEKVGSDPYERAQFVKEVSEVFNNYSDTYLHLNISYDILLYGYNGFQFSSIEMYDFSNFKEFPWYKKTVEADGQVVWTGIISDKKILGGPGNAFVISRVIKGGDRLQPVGILSLIVDEKSLYRSYQTSQTEFNEFFIVDQDGFIISHQDKAKLGKKWDAPFDELSEEDGRYLTPDKKMITYQKLTGPDWWLVEIAPVNKMMEPLDQYRTALVFIMIFCIAGCMCLSYLVSKYLSEPIVRLKKGMKQLSQGNFDLQLKNTTHDEMSELVNGFNQMSADIRLLVEDIKVSEREKNQAEIKYLQAQINPHFVYNTLNSIRCMILMKKNNDASNAIMAMNRLMRKALDSRMYVTLDEELDCLHDYVSIQKSQYGEGLRLETDIAVNTRIAMIPKLILQPIVENSIFHGIVGKKNDGIIKISSFKEEGNLNIIVADNGSGFTPDTLSALTTRLENETPQESNHIALPNINRRLKRIYGEKYGLEILPSGEWATKIRICLPYDIGQLEKLSNNSKA